MSFAGRSISGQVHKGPQLYNNSWNFWKHDHHKASVKVNSPNIMQQCFTGQLRATNCIIYTTIQKFGVSKIFLLNKLFFLFSKDALNCSKLTVKTSIMKMNRFPFLNNCCCFFCFILILKKCITVSTQKNIISTTVFNIGNNKCLLNIKSALVVDRYIGIFQISALADTFFSCLADAFEAGLLFWRCWERSAWAQCSHSPSCSLSSLTVLSNTDRSLSNNQIERLNKRIKMYTKSIITIAFILLIIERQTLEYFLVCRQHSANTSC